MSVSSNESELSNWVLSLASLEIGWYSQWLKTAHLRDSQQRWPPPTRIEIGICSTTSTPLQPIPPLSEMRFIHVYTINIHKSTPPGDSKSWKNPWVLGVYLLFSENDGLWSQTPETPKTPCFWKGNWMSSVFFKVWGLSWAKWKLPLKTLEITRKNPANFRKTPTNIRKSPNDGELKFSDSQGLVMAPLDSVALSNDTKHLKLLKSLESGNFWFFSRRMNLQAVWFLSPSTVIRFAASPRDWLWQQGPTWTR